MIRIVVTKVGMIIGNAEKLKTDQRGSCWQITEPRVFTVKPGKIEGSVDFKMQPLVGKPWEMSASGDSESWDVSDEIIINTYKRAVSGLILPEADSPVGKVVDFPHLTS